MTALHPSALLGREQSRAADSAAIESGIAGEKLMENAGRAVTEHLTQHYTPCRVLVVCGTGNNGGDGFVVARLLKERGWNATLALAGDGDAMTGDAKLAKDKWNREGGASRTFKPDLLGECDLVVDALFSTGLNRNLEDEALAAVKAINASKHPVIAIDIASGVHADDGSILGDAIRATHTVTFVRAKPGHVLLPGKAHTGILHVYDIGVTGEHITPTTFLNAPPLWISSFPIPGVESHKYSRGHTLIYGGDLASSGAARLAAYGALRAGAGLVSVACTQQALPAYAASLTAPMTKVAATAKAYDTLLTDKRITAAAIGPGFGTGETTRERVLQLLSHKKPCVLDADALTAFATNPASLFHAIGGSAPTLRPKQIGGGKETPSLVLTPHEGEFSRLFKADGSKIQRALSAAKQSGAVVVLKGNDTIIASPDGRAAINANAPPWLATAGAGDVLTGMIAGLLAGGMPAFHAACAATWLHGEAALRFGPGLIAEDLPHALPAVLKELYA